MRPAMTMECARHIISGVLRSNLSALAFFNGFLSGRGAHLAALSPLALVTAALSMSTWPLRFIKEHIFFSFFNDIRNVHCELSK